VKNFTKLALSALTIAVCFAACTKDNSVKTTSPQPSVKINSINAVSFAKKDTITPQVKTKFAPTVATKDTITPK
jgi:hypothetical protein